MIEKFSDHRFFDQNKQLRKEIYVDCARWKNLVYVRTLKCGSEFFYRNFTEVAGWETEKYENIDWEKDHAFSYCMDPVKRRHKGIAEFLIHTGTVDLLMEHDGFGEMLAQVPFLDEHSVALTTLYKDRINLIDWIPLTGNHGESVKFTQKLLSHFGHERINWDYELSHATSVYMDPLYKKIKALWEKDANIQASTKSYFLDEVEFWLTVNQKFNTHGDNWYEISWLRDVRF
jgi:hypothetical protein